MPIEVRLFPCLSDNYGYLVRDTATGDTAAVDTPDGQAVLGELQASGWCLSLILNTHWHPDHTQGNADVQAATGAQIVGPAEVRRAAPLDREVKGGDEVVLGRTRFQVLDTGGHTLGHISYYDAANHAAFVGDTLFALGCGRLFEGTPAMMWDSLQRLSALPDETTVYCAHEYTASNARYALTLDRGEALATRAREVFAARQRGEPTVPTSIGVEKATNPFLRALELVGGDPVTAFTKIRAGKDDFKG
ncbi:hydroxyacylglutathione hydrolase [Caulobacter sp. S45]|uniref:hydroxyacylglutathione hydrolase n=1 Tax=Caulobacter sp. S45 TaxID=1641861 RepID=UPI001575D05D|nr:hydroxyacylglutathione hydrolase [Caulobacter sp. S45]